jgi:ribosome maturation factor RimP
MSESLASQVAGLAAPLLADLQIELVDIEFQREGRDWFLRLFIDRVGGVTLDDCAQVSRELDALLEVEELIGHAYRLEVSSPGLDRPLKKAADYQRYAGEFVKIKTFETLDPDQRGHTRKTFTGILLGLENDKVRIEQQDKRGGVVEFGLEQIAKANLDPQF